MFKQIHFLFLGKKLLGSIYFYSNTATLYATSGPIFNQVLAII